MKLVALESKELSLLTFLKLILTLNNATSIDGSFPTVYHFSPVANVQNGVKHQRFFTF